MNQPTEKKRSLTQQKRKKKKKKEEEKGGGWEGRTGNRSICLGLAELSDIGLGRRS